MNRLTTGRHVGKTWISTSWCVPPCPFWIGSMDSQCDQTKKKKWWAFTAPIMQSLCAGLLPVVLKNAPLLSWSHYYFVGSHFQPQVIFPSQSTGTLRDFSGKKQCRHMDMFTKQLCLHMLLAKEKTMVSRSPPLRDLTNCIMTWSRIFVWRLYVSTPKVDWLILHSSFMEVCSVVFVSSCWQTNQTMDTGENMTSLAECEDITVLTVISLRTSRGGGYVCPSGSVSWNVCPMFRGCVLAAAAQGSIQTGGPSLHVISISVQLYCPKEPWKSAKK